MGWGGDRCALCMVIILHEVVVPLQLHASAGNLLVVNKPLAAQQSFACSVM